MIDNLYNPDSMSKEDIKTLFVARQPLLDELVSTVKNQPQGAGVQHVLIIAPRGMGKTTMLLMLQFAIEDSKKLSKDWQPIRFPEESYGITELADFWIKVLHYLADATKDETLETKIAELEKRFPKSEDLREAAWATVKDWSKTHKKRIALMVDNFDMILSQINNDTEQARLRDILMNDGTVMLIGCAPSYFREIQDYGQPLYNFFKVSNLSDLKFADIEELLRRRAEVDEIENIEELLQKNRTRIKALEAFTGGNPRLVLMLYRITTSSDMTEVRKGLEKLLDAVTPYYKDKTEKLPPQQRKIINEIAQYSLEKREGISPTEIAQRIRMTPNQVSSQLKRLAENGYVRSLNIRGRSSFYTLSEPLYAIWAQMRFGRNAREKRNWLVQFLKAIYDEQELQKEIQKVTEKYTKLQEEGQEQKAQGTLEFLLCLLETDSIFIQNNFNWAVYGYLILEEMTSLKIELTPERIVELPKDYIKILQNRGLINSENIEDIKSEMTKKIVRNLVEFIKDLLEDVLNEKLEVALNKINYNISQYESEPVLEKDEDYYGVGITLYFLKVLVLAAIGDFEKSLVQCNQAIQMITSNSEETKLINELMGGAYIVKGLILKELSCFEESITSLKEAILLIQNTETERIFNSENKINILIFANLQKTFTHLIINQVKEASKSFVICKELMKQTDWDWITIASTNLLETAKTTGLKSIKDLIILSKFEDEFFPLARAIDYLETKDEDLIEKLSPEVRIVVEETVRTLQMVSEEKSESKPNQKVKNKKDRKSEKSLALSE